MDVAIIVSRAIKCLEHMSMLKPDLLDVFIPNVGEMNRNESSQIRYFRAILTCIEGPKTLTLLGLRGIFRVHSDSVQNMFAFASTTLN